MNLFDHHCIIGIKRSCRSYVSSALQRGLARAGSGVAEGYLNASSPQHSSATPEESGSHEARMEGAAACRSHEISEVTTRLSIYQRRRNVVKNASTPELG